MAENKSDKTDPTNHPARPPGAPAPPAPHASDTAEQPAAAAVPPAPPKIRTPPLEERFFKPREFKQNVWSAIIPKNVNIGDLLEKEFWSHVRAKLSPGDMVCCFHEDRRWYVELIVFQVGVNWVSVSLHAGPTYPDKSSVGKSIGTDFEVRELGEIKRWGIVRVEDGREVSTGHQSAETAQRWLGEYIRTIANQKAA